MNAVNQAIRRARRRQTVGRFVGALGRALAIAGAVALALIVADRLFALRWSVFLLLSAPAALAVVAAMVEALVGRDDLLTTASHVDSALELRDRLGSAISLEGLAADDPFAALAIEDAQRVARTARVPAATPIRFGASWLAWPVIGALALASAIFVPALDLAHRRADQDRMAATEARVADVKRDIERARSTIAPKDISAADLATPADLAVLDQIQEQLSSGKVDPDQARTSAASALEQAANRFDKAARAQDDRLDALRDRLGDLDAGASAAKSSPLSEALKAGDFQTARRILDEQQRLLNRLDEIKRKKLADELDNLADALEKNPDNQASKHDSPADDDLRELGLSEPEINKLRDQADRGAIEKTLRDRGVDQPAADKLADELERDRAQRQAQEKARQDADQLRQALRQSADEARPKPPAPSPPEPKQDEPSNPKKSASSEKNANSSQDEQKSAGDNGSGSRSAEKKTGSDASSQQRPAQSERNSTTEQRSPDQPPSPDSARPAEKKTGSEKGAEQPQGQQQDTQGQQGAKGEQSTRGQQSQEKQGETPGSEQKMTPAPSPQPEPSASEKQPGKRATDGEKNNKAPGEKGVSQEKSDSQNEGKNVGQDGRDGRPAGKSSTGARPAEGKSEGQPEKGSPAADGQSPADGAPGRSDKGFDRARRLLNEFSKRKRDAQGQRRSAQEARRRARELLDNMSPAQREQLERWASELSREKSAKQQAPAPTGFSREPVDMRSKGPSPERVIAQWFNPDAGAPDQPEVSHRRVDQRLRQAAKGAQRAIEKEAVPRRYSEIIKRYFDTARRTPTAQEKSDAPAG